MREARNNVGRQRIGVHSDDFKFLSVNFQKDLKNLAILLKVISACLRRELGLIESKYVFWMCWKKF